MNEMVLVALEVQRDWGQMWETQRGEINKLSKLHREQLVNMWERHDATMLRLYPQRDVLKELSKLEQEQKEEKQTLLEHQLRERQKMEKDHLLEKQEQKWKTGGSIRMRANQQKQQPPFLLPLKRQRL